MYLCTFKKIKNNHDRLRIDEAEGLCTALPSLGNPVIFLYGESRIISTNLVVNIVKVDNVYTVTTASDSIYQITIIAKQKSYEFSDKSDVQG